MPLPALWVDHLFAKLTVRYGQVFQRLYADLDIAAVKADWADVLDGFDGQSIAYALQYLPGTPPNALQFRDICRRAPRNDQAPQLEAPVDREGAARAMSMIRAALNADDGKVSPAQKCIDNIDRIETIRKLTPSQAFVREACRIQAKGDPVESGVSQYAKMIPAEALPPAMREAA